MKKTLFALTVLAGAALIPVAGTRAQTVRAASPAPAAATPSPVSPSAAPAAVSTPADQQSPTITNSPPPLPSPKPASEDPKIRKVAMQQFLAWQGGNIDRDRYGEELNAQLSDDYLDGAEKALAALGALQTASFRGIAKVKGIDVYYYRMACEHGSIDMDFALQPDGKIALLFFV